MEKIQKSFKKQKKLVRMINQAMMKSFRELTPLRPNGELCGYTVTLCIALRKVQGNIDKYWRYQLVWASLLQLMFLQDREELQDDL